MIKWCVIQAEKKNLGPILTLPLQFLHPVITHTESSAQLRSKMSSRKNLVPELCSEIKLEYLLLNHEAAWCARQNISATVEFIVYSNNFRGRLLKLTQLEEQLGIITCLGVCSHFAILFFFWVSLVFSFLCFITFLNFTFHFVFNLNGMKDCLENESYTRHSMLTWFI